jgi:carboxymethylenebutenolidase
MGEMIEYPVNGHAGGGYLALPAEPGPAVVICQEYWGLVDQIKGVADRLAAEGFAVLVPDLYHGAKSTEPDEAAKLMMAMEMDRVAKDLRSAVTYMLGRDDVLGDRVGVIGFCMGGGLAVYFSSIEARVGATVDYYGAIPWDEVDLDVSTIAADVLLHYASEDTWASPEFGRDLERRLREAGVGVTFHIYEGAEHAFLDETRDSYEPEAARVSWERTIEFLQARLPQ